MQAMEIMQKFLTQWFRGCTFSIHSGLLVLYLSATVGYTNAPQWFTLMHHNGSQGEQTSLPLWFLLSQVDGKARCQGTGKPFPNDGVTEKLFPADGERRSQFPNDGEMEKPFIADGERRSHSP